jgi:Skp family chaperone for outer membrane proteins
MRFLSAVALFAGLTCAPFALADKIVLLDAQQAILATDKAKTRSDELKKRPEYAKMIVEAESLKAELARLNEKAQSDGLTWSEAEQAEFRKTVQGVQTDFQFVVQKIQKENEALVQQLLAEGQGDIGGVLEKIMKADAIDLIIRREAALIALPSSDITAKVTSELNKLHAEKK